MKYAIRNFALAVTAIVLFTACSSMPLYMSKKKIENSEAPSPFFDRESKIIYSVEHDNRFVYLNLSATDPTVQRQLLRGGLTIWIDQSGRKNENLGFRYPLSEGAVPSEFSNGRGGHAETFNPMENEKERSHHLLKQFEEQITYIELLGFLEEGSFERLNYKLEKGPIKVDITMNAEGKLFYVARVPLNSIFSDIEEADRLVSIGIIGNEPAGGRPQGPKAGVAPQGRGGQGGGQRGGGQGRGAGGTMALERNTGYSSNISFWFKAQL